MDIVYYGILFSLVVLFLSLWARRRQNQQEMYADMNQRDALEPVVTTAKSKERDKEGPRKASKETPHVKDLLHLKGTDTIPMVFRFAGRTFVWRPGSPPSYMVCSTKEDQDTIREEILAYDFGKGRGRGRGKEGS